MRKEKTLGLTSAAVMTFFFSSNRLLYSLGVVFVETCVPFVLLLFSFSRLIFI